jgi:hypothetical protein
MAKTFKIETKTKKIQRIDVAPTTKIDPSKLVFSKFNKYNNLSKLELEYILENEDLDQESINYVKQLINK